MQAKKKNLIKKSPSYSSSSPNNSMWRETFLGEKKKRNTHAHAHIHTLHACVCLHTYTAGLCDQAKWLLQCLLKLMIFGIFHSSSNRVCFRTIKRRKDNHLHTFYFSQHYNYTMHQSPQSSLYPKRGYILSCLNCKCLYVSFNSMQF